MSTKGKNLTDPNSCWSRAGDDEEIFVLRSTDPLAPGIIAEWARRYALRKIDVKWNAANKTIDVVMLPRCRVKYEEAMRTAERMTKALLEAGRLPEVLQPDPELVAEVIRSFGGSSSEEKGPEK